MKLRIRRWEHNNAQAMQEDVLHIDGIFPNRKQPFYELFSSYTAYQLWCDNPRLNVMAELCTDRGVERRTYLPYNDQSMPWAMESLAEHEAMRDELFIGVYLYSEE